MTTVDAIADPAQRDRLARARALVPVLRERAEATNANRRIPPETIDDFWNAGLFGLLKPKRFGGQEIRYDDFLEIGGVLGEGDGSAAWVYAVVTVHELMLALYPEEVQQALWENPRLLVASSFIPSAQPTREGDGYRVSGRWTFCSGVDSAQWMVLSAVFGMVGDPPHPDIRFMLLPISDCKIIDDWYVSGLRGTGSKSVVVENAYVPANRVVGAEAMGTGQAPGGKVHAGHIYRAPLYAVLPFCLSCAARGIARAGYERFVEGIRDRAATLDHQSIAQMRHIQMRIAEAAALLDAGELLYRRSAKETIDKIEAGEALSIEHRLRSRRDQAFSVKMATDALGLLVKSMGGKGLYDNNPVRRAHADLQAMAAHIAVTWDVPSASYGSVVLGGPPLDFLF